MKMKLAVVLLLSVKYCFASVIGDQDVGSANDYVDTVLENLRKDPEIAQHLEVLTIPDYTKQDFNIRNVAVKGLLSLYRHDDCSLSRDNGKVNVVANIAVRDVYVTMDYSAKVMFFWINGKGIISVDHLAVRLEFSSNNAQSQLTAFKVTDLGDYRVKKMTGLSFVLNWLLKLMANAAAQSARQSIINALENETGKALGDLISKKKLPIY